MVNNIKKELLIEIMTSALNDDLCGGCSEFAAPYAYENGGGCQKCRSIAAIEIASIIRSDAPTMDAVEVVHGHWDDIDGHCGKVEKVLAWMPLPKPWEGIK